MKHVWMMSLALAAILAGCQQPAQTRLTMPVDSQQTPDTAFDPQRPPSAQTMYVMAEILISQGYEQRAEALLGRIGVEYPEYLPAYNTMAEIRMRARRIPEAMATLQAGLKVQPADPVLWNNMGMCWLIRQEYQNALDCFVQAAGIAPENTRYRSNMATSLALLGRSEEALALYQQILPKQQAMENVRLLSLEIRPRTQPAAATLNRPAPD